jgi:hypothetical protein
MEQLKNRGRDFIVIELTIPEEDVYKRLKNRIMCKSCGTNFNALIHGEIDKCMECG